MKERPILLSASNVRGIIEGRKTQTRMKLNPQPWSEAELCGGAGYGWSQKGKESKNFHWNTTEETLAKSLHAHCPYGVPGDRLWVKETWCAWDTTDEEQEANEVSGNAEYLAEIGICRWNITYRADPRRHAEKWRPSIFMPRWASRITLEIEAVRVERLIEIATEDCIAEGIYQQGGQWIIDGSVTGLGWMQPEGAYRELWESINGPGSWDANPWVWVIQFRRITP